MLSKGDLRTPNLGTAGVLYVTGLVSFTVDTVSLNITRGTQTTPLLPSRELMSYEMWRCSQVQGAQIAGHYVVYRDACPQCG
jgi:hypothetical protein